MIWFWNHLELQGGNPFLDSNMGASHNPSIANGHMLCATEFQHHPHFFQLPSSSPYENFLKAAGCWCPQMDSNSYRDDVSTGVLWWCMQWLGLEILGGLHNAQNSLQWLPSKFCTASAVIAGSAIVLFSNFSQTVHRFIADAIIKFYSFFLSF